MDARLTHVDDRGSAHMVDVGDKPLTRREAVASGRVVMAPSTRALVLEGRGPKGPVIELARIAGIGGAKRVADLVPLCHPLPLDAVDVTIAPCGDDALTITATATTTWRTGVEMEALAAVVVAGLAVIDMVKAVDRGLELTDVRLERKSGGRSGAWCRTSAVDGAGPRGSARGATA